MVKAIPHGIARYVESLATGLDQLRQSLGLPYEPIFLVSSEYPQPKFQNFQIFKTDIPFLKLKEITALPNLIKHLTPQLYHSPSFSSLWSLPCPSLVTIHDLNHLHFGSLSNRIYYQFLLKRFARRCERIITVSQFSQQEISQWLDLPQADILIAENAVTLDTHSETVPLPSGLSAGKYFFCLSNSKPHKNLALLVEAYRAYRKTQQNAWPLVLSSLEFRDQPGVFCLGEVSEDLATSLLRNAGGAFFPSLYEGFGLPPVEAALAGVPIAVSKIPPHQEGLKDLSPQEVQWVLPQDLHGWVQAFARFQKGEFSGPSVDAQSRTRNRLSTENLARKMDRVYREVLGLK